MKAGTTLSITRSCGNEKPHACQTNSWEIIRMGMDIRINVITVVKWSLMPRRGIREEDEKR